jgi:hypothetical protein
MQSYTINPSYWHFFSFIRNKLVLLWRGKEENPLLTDSKNQEDDTKDRKNSLFDCPTPDNGQVCCQGRRAVAVKASGTVGRDLSPI